MLNKKLQADQWNEMVYQLLKFMIQKMNIKVRGGLLGSKGIFSAASSKVKIASTQVTNVSFDISTASTKVTTAYEVILNGNKVLKRQVGETEQEYEPTTTEEKQDRRNKMKARGTLLMTLPNKDQLKFHSYKDAKLLMEAIEKRYGGNKESKKVQRTLLKQQYKNFARSSEVIAQEDINLKLLRSLPSEWKTHTLIWSNKEEIETISLDDLYNNLEIYEPELIGSSSTSQNLQNVTFVSSNSTNSNSSTNEADNTTYGVSAAHTQNNPVNSTSDLEQIDPDDLEEMDLHGEMAMLTIRARRFIKRTGRKLDINGTFIPSKFDLMFMDEIVESENVDVITVITPSDVKKVETNNESADIEEEHPTNFALMAYTSSGSSSNSDSEVDSCSKTCVKAYWTRQNLTLFIHRLNVNSINLYQGTNRESMKPEADIESLRVVSPNEVVWKSNSRILMMDDL
ncbi:hypothetical protein Tco_0886129 [Tanacetum coccineum]